MERREGDSNPRRLAPQRFSRPSQSSALPSLRRERLVACRGGQSARWLPEERDHGRRDPASPRASRCAASATRAARPIRWITSTGTPAVAARSATASVSSNSTSSSAAVSSIGGNPAKSPNTGDAPGVARRRCRRGRRSPPNSSWRRRQHRIDAVEARHAPRRAREVGPWRQRHHRGRQRGALVAEPLQGREREPAAGRVAHDRDVRRFGAPLEHHAIRRHRIVERGGVPVLRGPPVPGQERLALELAADRARPSPYVSGTPATYPPPWR